MTYSQVNKTVGYNSLRDTIGSETLDGGKGVGYFDHVDRFSGGDSEAKAVYGKVVFRKGM